MSVFLRLFATDSCAYSIAGSIISCLAFSWLLGGNIIFSFIAFKYSSMERTKGAQISLHIPWMEVKTLQHIATKDVFKKILGKSNVEGFHR